MISNYMFSRLEKKLNFINDYSSTSLSTFKKETLEELSNAKYNDLEDMVKRMQLTFDEIIVILDLKFIRLKRIGHPLHQGIYETSDLNKTLEYISPHNVKVTCTIDDVRLKSHLNNNETLLSTQKSFFYTILGFTQPWLSASNDPPERYIQKIAGTCKIGKPINNTGIDKIPLKCDCINGSIVNCIRKPIWYSSL